MKNTSQRREDILKSLKKRGSLSVNQLSQKYNVSPVTIRNDLTFLESLSLLIRSHGGAIAKPEMLIETSITEKSKLNSSKKNDIAKKAASIITPFDSIILDSGTTTEKIIDHIDSTLTITAMTNGLNIAQKLSTKENINVMITGGNLRRESLSFYGLSAEESLKSYHFDKLFLGVDGFHLTQGLSTHNEYEARLNKIMSDVAKEIIIVTDSTKFGKICLHKILSPEKVTTIITDKDIPNEYLTALKQQNINILLA